MNLRGLIFLVLTFVLGCGREKNEVSGVLALNDSTQVQFSCTKVQDYSHIDYDKTIVARHKSHEGELKLSIKDMITHCGAKQMSFDDRWDTNQSSLTLNFKQWKYLYA